jgi:outer membrane protein assembly factor BamB
MSEPFAVVPIFVNAGAALLPAILGALVSALSLLFRPRELWRACRRRPAAALATGGSVALLIALGVVFWPRSNLAGAARAKDPSRPDWPTIARDILRRRELDSLGLATAAAPTAPQQASPIVFRWNYARQGHDGGPAPVGLKLLWEYKPDDTIFLSSPLAVQTGAGPRVYAATCQLDITGKYGSVVCLDATTGNRLWETTSLDEAGEQPLKPFFSSPALTADGKYLLIGQGLHDDADCHLLCLETGNGRVRWRARTPLHIESSPAVRGDLVVVGAGAIEDQQRRVRGEAGYVLAVRIADGSELWRYPVADPESSPAIADDGTVYIGSGFNGSAVYALRSESDAELEAQQRDRLVWRTPAPYPVTGAVTLSGELLLVGGGNADYVYGSPEPAGVVMALERRSGEVRWRRQMPDAVLGPIAVHATDNGGVAYCPVRSGEVVALALADGRVLWRQRVSERAPVLAGCAVAGSVVYATSRDGYLAVLRAADGKVLEKHYINREGKPGELGLTLGSPLVALGRLFVGSETGGLRCYTGRIDVRKSQ